MTSASSIPELPYSTGKAGFVQLREQLIEEGFGPGDIVFGQDLFDPKIDGQYAPYSDALRDDETPKRAVYRSERRVSELSKTGNPDDLQAMIREHLSEVLGGDLR